MCDAKAEESVSEAQLAALADELPILGELLRARFEGPDLDLDAAKFYAALGPRLEHEWDRSILTTPKAVFSSDLIYSQKTGRASGVRLRSAS